MKALPIADGPAWMQSAHCVKLDQFALLLPEPRGTDTAQLCRRCPVRPTCMGWALVIGADEGVLGGIEPDQRRVIRERLLERLDGRPMAGSPELAEVVRTHTRSRVHRASEKPNPRGNGACRLSASSRP